MNLDSKDDHELVVRIQNGSQRGANELVKRFAPRLQALTRHNTSARLRARVDPEDVVQSVFRSFFDKLRAGDVHSESDDELWRLLAAIARNKIRKLNEYHHAEKRDLRRSGPLAEDFQVKSLESDPELLAAANDVLAQLPAQLRSVVRMRLAGHTAEEIAEAHGRSLRSAERLIADARVALKKFLQP